MRVVSLFVITLPLAIKAEAQCGGQNTEFVLVETPKLWFGVDRRHDWFKNDESVLLSMCAARHLAEAWRVVKTKECPERRNPESSEIVVRMMRHLRCTQHIAQIYWHKSYG